MKIDDRLNVILKPDYYDIIPSYSREELIERFSILPFHLVTLLSPRNIKRALDIKECRDGLTNFLSKDFSDQRRLLCEVLDYRGFSKNVINGIERVKRENFIPKRYQYFSYLDTSIPFTKYSVVSNPTIVAIMIEMLNAQCGERILEIGIGSGYHALCLIECLEGKCDFTGVEINPDFFKFGSDIINSLNYRNVSVLLGNETQLINRTAKYHKIYSASSFANLPSHISQLLVEKGIFQATRPLSNNEFEIENQLAWVKKTFSNYEKYIMGNWRQEFACLTAWQLEVEKLREISVIYDVAFVPYRTGLLQDDNFEEKELFPEFKFQ